MSKIHIDQMAAAVKKYFAEAQIAQQKMKKNSEIYQAEFAVPENEKIKQHLQEARWAAEDAIKAAQEAGRAEAESWGKLDGSKLPDDVKLLQFDITPEQFSDLVARHKNNGTMAALLKQYGEKMNKRLLEETSGKNGTMPEKQYNTWEIPTVEEKRAVYDKFASGAMARLSNIDNGGGVDSFNIPTEFTKHLFDTL